MKKKSRDLIVPERGRGRPRKFTEKQLRRWHREAVSMKQLALLAGVTKPIIYKRCTEFGLDYIRSNGDFRAMLLCRGKRSLKQIATLLGTSRKEALHILMQEIKQHWLEGERRFPKPVDFIQAKLYNAIVKNRRLYDEPDALAEECGASIEEVRAYLERCWELWSGGQSNSKKT